MYARADPTLSSSKACGSRRTAITRFRPVEYHGPMDLVVRVGDICDEQVDVLVSTGNVWLNMSGGVNAEILQRAGPEIQRTLHHHLEESGKRFVEPGTAILVPGHGFHVPHIVYTVAIDGFYDSSPDLVTRALKRAFALASELGCKRIAVPALATGYGKLKIAQFAEGLMGALPAPFEEMRIVLSRAEYADEVCAVLSRTGLRDRLTSHEAAH